MFELILDFTSIQYKFILTNMDIGRIIQYRYALWTFTFPDLTWFYSISISTLIKWSSLLCHSFPYSFSNTPHLFSLSIFIVIPSRILFSSIVVHLPSIHFLGSHCCNFSSSFILLFLFIFLFSFFILSSLFSSLHFLLFISPPSIPYFLFFLPLLFNYSYYSFYFSVFQFLFPKQN